MAVDAIVVETFHSDPPLEPRRRQARLKIVRRLKRLKPCDRHVHAAIFYLFRSPLSPRVSATSVAIEVPSFLRLSCHLGELLLLFCVCFSDDTLGAGISVTG